MSEHKVRRVKGKFGNQLYKKCNYSINRITLKAALNYLNVYDVSPRNKRLTNTPVLHIIKASENRLFDLFEAAEKEYKNRIKVLHPDNGGDTNKAAELNVVWKRTKMLFKRLGIEKCQ